LSSLSGLITANPKTLLDVWAEETRPVVFGTTCFVL
jgi:hypothetical protein